MPLTTRRKFGISYICQPLLSPQLGVFSTVHNDKFCVNHFIEAIPKKFKIIDIAINSKNYITNEIRVNQIIECDSQVLRLVDYYKSIYNRYKESNKRNIRKFGKQEFVCDILSSTYLDFYKNKIDKVLKEGQWMGKQDSRIYFNVLKQFHESGNLKILEGFDVKQNVVGGICCFYIDDRVFIQTFNHLMGRHSGLIFFLIDYLIKKHSGQKIQLDFMGSSLPGVKYRNIGFGSQEEKYSLIRINRLPKIAYLLKKLM